MSRLGVQYQLYTNTSPPPIYRRNSQKPNARDDEFPSLIHSPCGLSVNARPMDCHSRPLDPVSQAVASFRLASSRDQRIQSFFIAAWNYQRTNHSTCCGLNAAYDITTRADTQGGILIFFIFFRRAKWRRLDMQPIYIAHIGIMMRAYTIVFTNCQ